MGFVHLNNIIFHATHGVNPEEAIIGTYFSIDLKIETDFSASYSTDDLNDTTNYQLVYELLETEMKKPSKLIEHLMARIANSLKKNIDCKAINIKVTKHYPPVKGLNSVSVSDVF